MSFVKKITARVFCNGEGGGNPVTIFCNLLNKESLHVAEKKRLAQSCAWESVFVQQTGEVPELSFYMPTGEEVSFCAHAAMGGISQISTEDPNKISDSKLFKFQASMDTSGIVYSAVAYNNAMVTLEFSNVQWVESPISDTRVLLNLLRKTIGLQSYSLIQRPNDQFKGILPTFCNSSIARPKTLVYVNSLSALHAATPPDIGPEFRNACDSFNSSTGLYLYTQRYQEEIEAQTTSWECRQFPRASGYAEDPATGIAAAALAVSLVSRGISGPNVKVYQGTTMGRKSLIVVDRVQLQHESTNVSFCLSGQIQVDKEEEVEIL